jgi:hypothetical protein
VLEELVREVIIHPSQLVPQEITGPGHRLILTTSLVLFSAAARARIIASRFAHRGLLQHVTVEYCPVVEGKTPARRADTPRYST